MTRREVWITGIGVHCPLGNSYAEVLEAFLAGRSAVRAIEGAQGRQRALACTDGSAASHFTRPELALLDPTAQFALVAARAAMADSGLVAGSFDRDRAGVFLGTGQANCHTVHEQMVQWLERDSVRALTLLKGMSNSAVNQVSLSLGFRGPSMTVTQACASSSLAIGQALRAIQQGELDLAMVGGAESPLVESWLRAWEALKVLAPVDPQDPSRSCKPFSGDRCGMALGEGAVLLMLESADHARARGARAYARLSGFGASTDATHIAQPDAQGQALALQKCLRDADLLPSDVGYVNAHGTATQQADRIEVAGLKQVFGAHVHNVAVSATKSLHGHLLGAAGAMELLAAIAAVHDGIIPPTANLWVPDPELDLDFVPHQARRARVAAALSSSFAFGGSNACLAVCAA